MTTLNNSFCIIKNDKQLSYFKDFKIDKPINKKYPGVILSNKKKHWFVPDDDGLNSRNFINYIRKTSRIELDANRYLNLLYDEVTDWRLEEIGFEGDTSVTMTKETDKYFMKICHSKPSTVYLFSPKGKSPIIFNIKNFSDLLTLIKLIG